jgi:hypothetical protein
VSGGAAELGATVAPRAISSRQTFFVKFILPVLWIGSFGAGVVAVSLGSIGGNVPPEAAWIFIGLWVLGTTMFSLLFVPLKKVSIAGNVLAISNYRRQIAVPATDIARITENRWLNYHPVTIHLRRDTALGRTITFMPKVCPFLFWRSHPIVAELRALASGQH